MCTSLRVYPRHQVSWLFTDSNGKEMELIQTHIDDSGDSSKYTINRESETTSFGTLTIVNATFEDQGTYKCNASNEIGHAEASANLTIQGANLTIY
jgi:hypothetical protein